MRNALVVALSLFGAAIDVSASDKAQAALDRVALAHGWPGAAVLFERPHDPAEMAATGFAELETRRPMTPDAAFHICSITKVFTAVAALRLVDEGKLSLDSKVTAILTSDVVRRIPNIEDVTVRQLLDHSSGIYATNNDLAYLKTLVGADAFTRRVWNAEELVALATLPENAPLGKPGTGHFYSDTNYVLLGMIVERVSGQPFKRHLARTIFEPLRMGATHFYSDVVAGQRSPSPKVASGYIRTTKELTEAIQMNPGFKSAAGNFLNTSVAAERIDAAAGIITTLPELANFARALFRGQLLKPKSQTFLTSVAGEMSGVEQGKKRLRALRGLNTRFGLVVFKEGDGPGGFNTLMAFHPDSGAIFLGFTNQFGGFDEVEIMIDEIMGPLVSQP